MAELPSGTVTFLFTDIESSTRLLKQLRDGYAAVLGEHQELLRAAFAADAGQVVDTQGDSFFVAFRRAKDAISAACGHRIEPDLPIPATNEAILLCLERMKARAAADAPARSGVART